MNLTYFHRKSIENLGKNKSSFNIRFVTKTSDIRNFSQNIRSDVKTSEVATLNTARGTGIYRRGDYHC